MTTTSTEQTWTGVLDVLDQPAPRTTLDQLALVDEADIASTVARQLDLFGMVSA